MISKTLREAFGAGVFISLGCIVNLKVGGIIGAILFSFGLVSVCYYGLGLYTGTAGFFNHKSLKSWKRLGIILGGNVLGTLASYLVCILAMPEVIEGARTITESRIQHGLIDCFLLAVGCGIIMSTAVEHYRDSKRVLPILLGVPLFIMAGFTHSIADSFYFLSVAASGSGEIEIIWVAEVLGNLLGCRLHRIWKY